MNNDNEPTTQPLPRLTYTYDEAVVITSVSRSTLVRAVTRREIGYVKIGRAVRFTLEQLMEWVEWQTVDAA